MLSRRDLLEYTAVGVGLSAIAGCSSKSQTQDYVNPVPTAESAETERERSGSTIRVFPDWEVPSGSRAYVAVTDFPNTLVQSTSEKRPLEQAEYTELSIPTDGVRKSPFGCYVLAESPLNPEPTLIAEFPPLKTTPDISAAEVTDIPPREEFFPFRKWYDDGGTFNFVLDSYPRVVKTILDGSFRISKTDFVRATKRTDRSHATIIDEAKTNPYVKRLAALIKADIEKSLYVQYDESLRAKAEAIRVATFIVQSITYEFDSKVNGIPEYPSFVAEYLVRRVGDCEDSTALLIGLLENMGFDTTALFFPAHIGVGVNIADVPDDLFQMYPEWSKGYTKMGVSGTQYMYIDTVNQQPPSKGYPTLKKRRIGAYDGQWTFFPENINEFGVGVVEELKE